MREAEAGSRESSSQAISVGGFDDASVCGHCGETVIERGGSNAACGAQVGKRLRLAGIGKCGGDAIIDGEMVRLGSLPGPVGDFEGERIGPLDEFETEGRDGQGGPMFDGERDSIVGIAPEIEVGIAPGMELGSAAQGLAGPHVSGAFVGMMDEDDGDGMAALQFSEVGEQRRRLTADILVDAAPADEGIEDEQARLQPSDGLVETGTIGVEVEAQTGRRNDLNVDIGEVEASGDADAVEAAAHDVQRVLGGVEQDPPGPAHGEAAQAGLTGGDGDGEVEGEEGFAAFGFAADDADGFLGP